MSKDGAPRRGERSLIFRLPYQAMVNLQVDVAPALYEEAGLDYPAVQPSRPVHHDGLRRTGGDGPPPSFLRKRRLVSLPKSAGRSPQHAAALVSSHPKRRGAVR